MHVSATDVMIMTKCSQRMMPTNEERMKTTCQERKNRSRGIYMIKQFADPECEWKADSLT